MNAGHLEPPVVVPPQPPARVRDEPGVDKLLVTRERDCAADRARVDLAHLVQEEEQERGLREHVEHERRGSVGLGRGRVQPARERVPEQRKRKPARREQIARAEDVARCERGARALHEEDESAGKS